MGGVARTADAEIIRSSPTVNKVSGVARPPQWAGSDSGTEKRLREIHAWRNKAAPWTSGHMDKLDKQKEEALIVVSLSTATLIACFGLALALI